MDALDLLFRRIILAAHASGALERPVTVGELLDDFAPYGAAKRDGALDSHDDYLHVLMRLVSGERSLAFGDDLMQDDLKAELESPDPDLTVLRTYAQTKLRLATAAMQEVLSGDTTIDLRPPTPIGPRRVTGAQPEARPPGAQPAPRASGARSTSPRGSDATIRQDGPGTMAGSAQRDAEPMTEPIATGALQQAFDAYAGSQRDVGTPATAVTSDRGCPYCAQALPPGRTVKFCPSCGQNLLVRRCPGCSAEIESGWKFCVTCGRKA